MKRLALVALLLAAGCGGSPSATPETTSPTKASQPAPTGGVIKYLVVEKGETRTLKDVTLTGLVVVDGTLIADRVRVDKSGSAGMVVTGTLRMTNSELFGDGPNGGDMVTTDDAQEVTIRNSEVHDVHCAFHLVGVGQLTLDGMDIHDNRYGFMAYGSDPSKVHRITNTRVHDNEIGLSETPGVEQGRIVVSGGEWTDSVQQISGKIEGLNG